MKALTLLLFVVLAVSVVAAGLFLLRDDSPPAIPNQNPVGQTFPSVVGQSLEEKRTELPAALAGQAAILLIGYEQEAQFDIDRWLLGLLQTEISAQIVEIPTIPGLVPSLISRWIDEGMRSGIPEEDWGSVVTLYGDSARPVAELTGTERGRLARVLVLNSVGEIVWFDDKGYSASKALSVAQRVEQLNAPRESIESSASQQFAD